MSGNNGKPGQENKKKPVVFIKTFGCQMNRYDTEVAASILRKAGYAVDSGPDPFADPEDGLHVGRAGGGMDQADIVILNTCSAFPPRPSGLYTRTKDERLVLFPMGIARDLLRFIGAGGSFLYEKNVRGALAEAMTYQRTSVEMSTRGTSVAVSLRPKTMRLLDQSVSSGRKLLGSEFSEVSIALTRAIDSVSEAIHAEAAT